MTTPPSPDAARPDESDGSDGSDGYRSVTEEYGISLGEGQ